MERYFIIYLDSFGIMMIYEDTSIATEIFFWKEEKRFCLSKQKLFFAQMQSQWLRDKGPQHSYNQPIKNERFSFPLGPDVRFWLLRSLSLV